jgi:hypothetical protein
MTVTYTAGFGGAGASADVATYGGAISDCMSIIALNGVWYCESHSNVTIA